MDVSRYTDTMELKFDVEFITPAFLGGADGNAEIRTAPFKNLIRRWWRIANGNLSSEELWKKESELFGSTEKGVQGKSKVVLRILKSEIEFQRGNQLRFPEKTIKHTEVQNPMSFETYLGMGPIFWNKDSKKSEYKFLPILEYKHEEKTKDERKRKELIIPERKSFISFAMTFPSGDEEALKKILSYINFFGTVGSRSRNGWGSIQIKNVVSSNNETVNLLKINDIKAMSVDWLKIINKNCEKKYPVAIAKDEKGLLCWCAPQRNSWDEAMLDAARIYSAVRTYFKFTNTDSFNDRHLLGYPITHHNVEAWPVKNTRLPSELCMKINFNQGKYRVQITHIPTLIHLMGFSIDKQLEIWNKVHDFFRYLHYRK